MNNIAKALLIAIITMLSPFLGKGAAAELTAAEAGAFRYFYIEAVRQQDQGNYINALELFNRCLEMNPDAPEVNYALGTMYMVLNQDSIGMRFLEHAAALEPGNTEFAERLARTYLYKNRIDDATAVYERITQQRPERTEYLELLVRIYEQTHDYEKMLSALNRLETQEGKSEDITLSKMQAYSFLGNQDGAYNELKSLIDAHPGDLNLRVMMGNWLLSNARKEEALETFLAVLREEPDNAQGQMSLMDFYRAEGQIPQADSLLYNVLINPRTEPSTRVNMLRDWVTDAENRGGDSIRVMELFDRVLALPQTTSEVAEIKVAYMQMKEAPADSIRKGLEQVLSIAPENVRARLQLIQIMWSDTIDENVIRECRKAVDYVSDAPELHYYLGLAQFINHHYEDAVISLRNAASHISEETTQDMSADIYCILGDIYFKLGRRAEAYAAYDSCLVYAPDKVMCLNNYAYYLSLEKQDLKKAEKMSYRAITAEPNSSTYLDTYAWILYQQKRYEEALIYIEQAIRCDSDSNMIAADIYDHAGDIYNALGRKTEAMEMWQKALEAELDTPEEMAILRKKIKKNK